MPCSVVVRIWKRAVLQSKQHSRANQRQLKFLCSCSTIARFENWGPEKTFWSVKNVESLIGCWVHEHPCTRCNTRETKNRRATNNMVVRVHQITSLAIIFAPCLHMRTRVGVTMTFVDASSPKLSPDFCPHSHCHICERCALPIIYDQRHKITHLWGRRGSSYACPI